MIMCAWLWLVPVRTRAQPEVVLHWEAPAGCPDQKRVEHELQRLLGASEATGRAHVQGTVRPGDGRFVLDLRVVDQDGEEAQRQLEAIDCHDLAEVTGLLVALSVDPDLQPAAPPEPPPAQEQQPPDPAETASSPPAVRRLTLQLAAWTGTGVLSRSPSFGPRVTPRWNAQYFSLGLQAAGLFETAQQSAAYPGASVASGVVLISPEVCFRADLAAWTLSPCAQLEVGATWLKTSGIESPSRAGDLWLAVGAEARAQWWVRPRWSLDLGVGLSVPLRRPTFAIDTNAGAVALHRASPAGLRVSVGVTYAAGP